MAKDILNRNIEYGGSFSADGLRITFSGQVGAGFMVQQVGIGYRTQSNRVYEVGSNRTYLIEGRTSGTGTISRLVGPKAFAKTFYQRFGDVCQLRNNHLALSLGVEACDYVDSIDSATELTLRHVYVEGVDYSVNAGDALFNERSSMQFFYLEPGNNPAPA